MRNFHIWMVIVLKQRRFIPENFNKADRKD